jgi:hypothetical protein
MGGAGITEIEDDSAPASLVIEELRDGINVPGSCTIFSIQAVAGVGTAGCALTNADYGRRE